MVKMIDGRNCSVEWIGRQLNRRSQLSLDVERKVVTDILKSVQKEGDTKVLQYTHKFDGVYFNSPDCMRVSHQEIENAYDSVSPNLIDVIKRAQQNISKFHKKQKQNSWINFEDGIALGQKVQPMERVGVYVPGGRAVYPSTVLMNVIPAQVAGVSEVIMVTPPQADGSVSPGVLVAANELGIENIYKVGGAQAVAALAYGTSTIPKVDKIVGPGNIYVTLAKKEVYGQVDIDMIAGPSEVLVIADDSANPSFVAADLMSQAEHDPMASAILITNSAALAEAVIIEIEKQIVNLEKQEIIISSLDNYGALIITDSIDSAIKLSNMIAPEHLELSVENPFDIIGSIKHAGAIFMGHYSPEPLGDYMAGPNHVLPTSGTARFFSPLSVDDFIKKSSIIFYNKAALSCLYKDIAEFAREEGLTAHANSVEVRFTDHA